MAHVILNTRPYRFHVQHWKAGSGLGTRLVKRSLVPRLHPVFQCPTLKNGTAWFAKSRAQHQARVNLMNMGRVQNGVPQKVTRYRATVPRRSFTCSKDGKDASRKTYTSTLDIFWWLPLHSVSLPSWSCWFEGWQWDSINLHLKKNYWRAAMSIFVQQWSVAILVPSSNIKHYLAHKQSLQWGACDFTSQALPFLACNVRNWE